MSTENLSKPSIQKAIAELIQERREKSNGRR
ncbi:MAG: terminase small subunit [Candidatus Thiodiazotropha sp. (ex Codakia rugifera)]|nr:terminase small subunit [Candidatus Thiodiazotropha sp. (ex Codakia rugifera)]